MENKFTNNSLKLLDIIKKNKIVIILIVIFITVVSLISIKTLFLYNDNKKLKERALVIHDAIKSDFETKYEKIIEDYINSNNLLNEALKKNKEDTIVLTKEIIDKNNFINSFLNKRESEVIEDVKIIEKPEIKEESEVIEDAIVMEKSEIDEVIEDAIVIKNPVIEMELVIIEPIIIEDSLPVEELSDESDEEDYKYKNLLKKIDFNV